MNNCKVDICPDCNSEMVVMVQTSFCPDCEKKKSPQFVKPTQVQSQPPTTHYFASGPNVGINPWSCDDAIQACTLLEPTLALMGWHIGLTGGCLYKHGCRKDVDFIIYPHVSGLGVVCSDYMLKTGPILTIAKHTGYNLSDITQSAHYKDDKQLFKIGDNIDVFVFGNQ